MRRTQRDVVLDVLRDGAWHSTRELQDASGGLRVPSRVDELRQRGYPIECRRSAGADGRALWVYRLVGVGRLRVRPRAAPTSRAASSPAPRPVDDCATCGKHAELVDVDALYCAACVPPPVDEPPAEADGQLVLVDRAM